MSENEEELPKAEIKLKKKKTRLKKITKGENEEEQESKNAHDENYNEDSEKILRVKRSKTVGKRRKKKINLEDDSDNEKENRKKKRKKRKKKEENNSSNNSDKEKDDSNNNKINNSMNDINEKSTKKKKRKKTKRRKKLEDFEEDNIKGDNNENDNEVNNNSKEDNNNIEENNDEEKPKKIKKRKKKKKIINKEKDNDNDENNNDNNIDNDENNEELVEKKKKKRKKKRKKKAEEENNDEENNNGKDESENNEENEEDVQKEDGVKKKKKKKKKKEKKLSFDNIDKVPINDQKEENEEKVLKPKKTKTRKENLISNPQRPTTSYILRGGQKTLNINNNPFLKEEEKINKNEEYDNYDIDWKIIKKKFLKEIEKVMNDLNIYDTIDIALISTTNFIKKEYGDFTMTNHHVISPLKKYNNINWAKEPFSLLKEKLIELSSPNNLISKNYLFDFSNRVCNEYEVYDAKINILKITGKNLEEKIKPEAYTFINKEEKDKLKPTLILFFSINDEKSINLYKEILFFLRDYNEEIIFMPINAPLIQEEKNIYFIMDMLNRYKVYKDGEKFEIYFCMDDALNKRFKYISEDNKRNIINKIVYLDVINNKFIVRAIKDLDNFTFNLINKTKFINKEKYKSTIKNLINLKKAPLELLKDTPLIEPYNCNWILRKAKIYRISKENKELKLERTLYDGLTGNTKGEHLYLNERNKYEKLFNLFYKLGNYQLRYNPAHFSLPYKSINKLIIKEMDKCLKMNNKLKEIKYQSIFQTNKIMLTIGSDFGIPKFMPIELNSFKLELQVDINLFEEYEPLNIIGAMQGLTLYTYFSNCDYISCYPKLGEIFHNEYTLTDSESFQQIKVGINPEGNKPSLLIIFSLALQNYFASYELSSRFKLIRNKMEKLYKEKKVNLYLIYRGEPSNFSERFDQIKDDPIFSLIPELYIKSSSNLKFPLVYQNNDIESTDSQIMAFILNKENKLIYSGNLEDIIIDKTFESLLSDNGEDKLIYKMDMKLKYEDYEKIIKTIEKGIEKIINRELSKENNLLYRPFFSISFNAYTNFINEDTDNQRYINHNRLRILIKEKHIKIFKSNEEFKKLSNELKKNYDVSTIVVGIECSNININQENNCDKCNKLISINKEPWYFDEESQKIFCEKCGEDFSNDIKNETFITFFKTNEFEDEVIQEMYTNFLKRDGNINPVLGDKCKICKNKIGEIYFLNMTHFNIEYSETPIIPIDICEGCFNEMRNSDGEPFLGDSKKRLNYEKFGLNYKHMIYRKIYIPLSGDF